MGVQRVADDALCLQVPSVFVCSRMQIPIKDLPAGETEDKWYDLGKAKSHEPDNPLGASVRVRSQYSNHFSQIWR